MSRRVVTTSNGVKIIYQKDKRLNANKLVDVQIPQRLQGRARQIKENTRQKAEVKFYSNGKPYIKTINYRNNGEIASTGVMSVTDYLQRKEMLKKPMFQIKNAPKTSLSPQGFELRNKSPSPSYKPLSPNYSKLSPESSIRISDKCMPQTFLYRSFKPKTGETYFNYVNADGIKNVVRNTINVPNSPTFRNPRQGIVYVASGTEGASFVGCLRDDCKEKVLIKASVANKPYKESPSAREFKINRDIFLKCKDSTPHIVMPYLLQICPPNKAFLPLGNRRLPRNMNITKDSHLAIGYYEFYNGGDLLAWMKRHEKSVTEKIVKTIIFQVLWTLGVMYKRVPSFRHNDVHPGNIFIKSGTSETGSRKYGAMFSVPNVGVISAIGDFGWAHSKSHRNPKVNSGEYKKNFGINKNKTTRQDVHLFLTHMYNLLKSMGKFQKTQDFLVEAMGAQELGNVNSNKIKFYRLLNNNNRVKSVGDILKLSYFDDFRVKNKQVPITKPAPKKNKILNKLKSNNMATRESTLCGKRAAPKAGGIRGMSVEEMINIIQRQGTPAAKAMLASFKTKPKRTQLCYILTQFRAGRKVIGINNNNNNSDSNNNNNIELIELRGRKRIFNMSKVELVNFLKSKGKNVPMNTKMANLVRMAKNANNRQSSRVKPKPAAPAINYLKIQGTRVKKPMERPVLAKGKPLTMNERRALNALAERIYNSMNRPPNANFNTLRNEARKRAIAKMNNIKKSMAQSGLNENYKLTMTAVNTIMPRRKRSPTRVMVMQKRISPAMRRSPVKRNYNPKTNMTRYSVNSVGKFRIEQKMCDTYSRKELDRIATRVGLNPRDFKNIKALCAGIMTKVNIVPYRTAARIEKNQNKMMENMKKNYEKNQENKLRRILEMRKRVREMQQKRQQEAPFGGSIVTRGPKKSTGTLELFKTVGLR